MPLFALVLLPVFLFLGINKIVYIVDTSGYHKQGEDCKKNQAISNDNSEFVSAQYQNAVTEIRLRLEHEHLLFALKFTLAGGLLGMIFKFANESNSKFKKVISEKSSILFAVACWSIVAVSAIIDVRAEFNAHIIALLGGWISYIELCAMPDNLIGWEHYFKEKETPLFNLIHMDRQLVTWVLYMVTLYIFVVAPVRSDKPQDYYQFLRVSQKAIVVCMLIFMIATLYFEMEDYRFLYFGIGVIIILISWKSIDALKKLTTESTESE